MERNSTILIVDDTEAAREVMEALLMAEGYNLAFASNGPEALEMAAELSPDVILLDIMMPDMDGFEVCQRLRADPPLAEVPVVMVTSLDDRQSRIQGIEAGADDFVSKPFDGVELRARIRTITKVNRYRQLLIERTNLQQAHDELVDAYSSTLEGWAKALELRDHETEGHCQRVTEMTVRLASKLGVKDDDLVHVHRGALLHDIGKIGIPDGILLKTGPLTDQEQTIMRQHPTFAYEMLSSIKYLLPAIDIPYCHHEKWEGGGYPRGLPGEEIPFPARIFAVVDVWDALTSDRPYRPAWSEEKALQQINTDAGTHFDPRVVEAFLAYMGC